MCMCLQANNCDLRTRQIYRKGSPIQTRGTCRISTRVTSYTWLRYSHTKAAVESSVTCSRLNHLPPARQQSTVLAPRGCRYYAGHRYRLAGTATDGLWAPHCKALLQFIPGLTGSRSLGRKWSSPLESSLHGAARLVTFCHSTLLASGMRLAGQPCSTHPGH